MEELENRLCTHQGKKVIVIRPGFGTQSESLVGEFRVFTENYPIKFGVVSLSSNVLFTVEDVKDVDVSDDLTDLIIMLKSPKDYN